MAKNLPDDAKKVLLSIGLIIPALFFLYLNFTKYYLGVDVFFDGFENILSNFGLNAFFNTVSPVFLLGGPAIALLLNFRYLLKTRQGKISSWTSLNGLIAVLSLMMLFIFLTYALSENYMCILGLKATC